MITALAILVAASTSGTSDAAASTSPVRVIVSEEQRKSCQYLGIVSGRKSGGTKNGERALLKAMAKVRKAGGNGLFIISQTDNWLEGTNITGEALLCP